MKLIKTAANFFLLLLSLIIGITLLEAGSRLFLNPADYLSVKMVPDQMLVRVIPPKTKGFDEWGFRNKTVPSMVDFVAIGDSHTYGNTATMYDSWPYVLGHLTDLSVYNMGLGGYGPNQYYHLLKTRALSLNPKFVLCGFYMGDDFENAFSTTYGIDQWAFLRRGDWDDEVTANIWVKDNGSRLFKGIRVWLSENSVIYRLVFHGPILGKIKGNIQVGNASRNHDEYTTSLIISDRNIREVFRPVGIQSRLDLARVEIKEGVRITKKLLKDMNSNCIQDDTQFVVVIIPTKEMVFADYLVHDSDIHLHDVINDLILNETKARNELFKFFNETGIRYIDTLPALRRAVEKELYTRSSRDMHPNKNGYRVIAETVAEFLKK